MWSAGECKTLKAAVKKRDKEDRQWAKEAAEEQQEQDELEALPEPPQWEPPANWEPGGPPSLIPGLTLAPTPLGKPLKPRPEAQGSLFSFDMGLGGGKGAKSPKIAVPGRSGAKNRREAKAVGKARPGVPKIAKRKR